MELHDLRPVHQTLTTERDQIRLSLAPPAQRGGPLLGTPKVEDLLTGVDHRAVDDADDDRGDLLGGDGHHGFVQPGHTLDDLPEEDERLAQAQPRQRHQVRVAEAFGDLPRLIEGCVGGLEIPAVQTLQG